MSNAIKCDVCKRCTPDINPRYKRRKYAWFRFDFDSQGGSNFRLDICEECWTGFNEFMKQRTTNETIHK